MGAWRVAMEKVGFVVLHFGDWGITDLCLGSIRELDGAGDAVVLVVDNEVKKSPEERERTRAHFEAALNVRVLRNEGDGGFSEANNLGYACARDVLECKFILVLNNDITFVQKDFLTRLKKVYEKRHCEVLAPDIVRASTGEHQNPLDVRIRTESEALYTIRMNELALKTFALSGKLLPKLEERSAEAGARVRQKNWGYFARQEEDVVPFGACLIFTPRFVEKEREAFAPKTQFFYEEYILALRCQREGYLVRYDPELRVAHESGKATKTLGSTGARTRFKVERTLEAAKVYLKYLRSGR